MRPFALDNVKNYMLDDVVMNGCCTYLDDDVVMNSLCRHRCRLVRTSPYDLLIVSIKTNKFLRDMFGFVSGIISICISLFLHSSGKSRISQGGR